MSRKLTVVLLAMLVLVGAMGLKTVVYAHGDGTFIAGNGSGPVPVSGGPWKNGSGPVPVSGGPWKNGSGPVPVSGGPWK
jgi:hypothetical protein